MIWFVLIHFSQSPWRMPLGSFLSLKTVLIDSVRQLIFCLNFISIRNSQWQETCTVTCYFYWHLKHWCVCVCVNQSLCLNEEAREGHEYDNVLFVPLLSNMMMSKLFYVPLSMSSWQVMKEHLTRARLSTQYQYTNMCCGSSDDLMMFSFFWRVCLQCC